MPNKHEVNKSMAFEMKPMNSQEINIGKSIIAEFLDKDLSFGYVMLLCKELSYYTIFKKQSLMLTTKGFADQVIRFIEKDSYMKTLGKLKYVDISDNYIEIWVGEYHFGLFNCDSFIVPL